MEILARVDRASIQSVNNLQICEFESSSDLVALGKVAYTCIFVEVGVHKSQKN